MKKTTIIMSISILFSCGSKDNIEKKSNDNQTKIELTKSEQKIEEFTVRALGNTMAEMKFDIPNITAKEGSKVKITLINESIDPAMIHNIVFIKYGTRKEIAMEAIQSGMSTKYIPNNNNVIAGSDLANPGETIILEFDAPKKGNYEFLCTYPGHSEMMRGYFFVK
tara:strand:+ start:953 stop:1450 length:498 start_codon:yes stop_codon:yes gene_type:complete